MFLKLSFNNSIKKLSFKPELKKREGLLAFLIRFSSIPESDIAALWKDETDIVVDILEPSYFEYFSEKVGKTDEKFICITIRNKSREPLKIAQNFDESGLNESLLSTSQIIEEINMENKHCSDLTSDSKQANQSMCYSQITCEVMPKTSEVYNHSEKNKSSDNLSSKDIMVPLFVKKQNIDFIDVKEENSFSALPSNEIKNKIPHSNSPSNQGESNVDADEKTQRKLRKEAEKLSLLNRISMLEKRMIELETLSHSNSFAIESVDNFSPIVRIPHQSKVKIEAKNSNWKCYDCGKRIDSSLSFCLICDFGYKCSQCDLKPHDHPIVRLPKLPESISFLITLKNCMKTSYQGALSTMQHRM